MEILISNISKTFGSFRALDNITLQIRSGELLALLGPSGCGKTTLLRIISGLEIPNAGTIRFLPGKDNIGNPVQRKVGFVFQHYALFKHMTVFENIAFGLNVRPRKERLEKARIRNKVLSLLKLIQIEWAADLYPNQLSGGQRQRVALARALAIEPEILLLDEPFGALDAKVRKDLRKWLRHLHDELHITSVFVTHDQEEALEVADRIVVMNKGKIEQIGSPKDVYDSPANPFVYNFLGNVNLFYGRKKENLIYIENIELKDLPKNKNGETPAADSKIIGYVRPHDIQLVKDKEYHNGTEYLVKHISLVGPIVKVELGLAASNEFIDVEISREEFEKLNLTVNEKISVKIKNLKVFDEFSIAAT